MSGYVNNSQATSGVFDDKGWYPTGDVGRIEEGKVYLVDRKKEMVKLRRWQIALAEIEDVVLKHADVVDSAVVGVKTDDQRAFKIPEIHVVRKSESQLTRQEVREFVLRYLARYKVHDCRIVFRSSIPKTASGKILRRKLSEGRRE